MWTKNFDEDWSFFCWNYELWIDKKFQLSEMKFNYVNV